MEGGQPGPDGLDVREEVGGDDEDPTPAVRHDLAERLAREEHVQRQVDGADLVARQPSREGGPAVGGAHHDDVAGPVSQANQHLGHPVHQVVTLGVGELGVRQGSERSRTELGGPCLEKGSQRLERRCDHQPVAANRRATLSTLPVALRGISSTTRTVLGTA